MSTVAQGMKKTAKQLAVDVAKKVAREPWEILKQVPKEVIGVEGKQPTLTPPDQAQSAAGSSGEQKLLDAAKLHAQSVRQLTALARELEDIRRLKQEQAQPKAEEEARKVQVEEQKSPEPPPQITTKPRRGLLRLVRGTKRTETRQPPSG